MTNKGERDQGKRPLGNVSSGARPERRQTTNNFEAYLQFWECADKSISDVTSGKDFTTFFGQLVQIMVYAHLERHLPDEIRQNDIFQVDDMVAKRDEAEAGNPGREIYGLATTLKSVIEQKTSKAKVCDSLFTGPGVTLKQMLSEIYDAYQIYYPRDANGFVVLIRDVRLQTLSVKNVPEVINATRVRTYLVQIENLLILNRILISDYKELDTWVIAYLLTESDLATTEIPVIKSVTASVAARTLADESKEWCNLSFREFRKKFTELVFDRYRIKSRGKVVDASMLIRYQNILDGDGVDQKDRSKRRDRS